MCDQQAELNLGEYVKNVVKTVSELDPQSQAKVLDMARAELVQHYQEWINKANEELESRKRALEDFLGDRLEVQFNSRKEFQ